MKKLRCWALGALGVSMILLCLSGCIQIYFDDDGYRAYGRIEQQYGRYPPFDSARYPADTNVLAYEMRIADLQQNIPAGRYRWLFSYNYGCGKYPPSIDQWAPFMDSVRQTSQVEFCFFVSNYDRFTISECRRWLSKHGWKDPIFVLSNAWYGNKASRKELRHLQELEGPNVDMRSSPVRHHLLAPNGRVIYTAREDENPKNQGAKPRATIEAEIRQLLLQP